MVIAPNDLFSWNNKYNEYNVTRDIYTLSSWRLCTSTHSVHARVLKPWRGSLPSISSSYHVFPPPLSGLNWRSLSPLGGPGPFTSKMVPLSTGSAHTPLPGFRTLYCSSIYSLFRGFFLLAWAVYKYNCPRFFFSLTLSLSLSLLALSPPLARYLSLSLWDIKIPMYLGFWKSWILFFCLILCIARKTKKKISPTFKISGALIVKLPFLPCES
jgi:hypothetical protein